MLPVKDSKHYVSRIWWIFSKGITRICLLLHDSMELVELISICWMNQTLILRKSSLISSWYPSLIGLFWQQMQIWLKSVSVTPFGFQSRNPIVFQLGISSFLLLSPPIIYPMQLYSSTYGKHGSNYPIVPKSSTSKCILSTKLLLGFVKRGRYQLEQFSIRWRRNQLLVGRLKFTWQFCCIRPNVRRVVYGNSLTSQTFSLSITSLHSELHNTIPSKDQMLISRNHAVNSQGLSQTSLPSSMPHCLLVEVNSSICWKSSGVHQP